MSLPHVSCTRVTPPLSCPSCRIHFAYLFVCVCVYIYVCVCFCFLNPSFATNRVPYKSSRRRNHLQKSPTPQLTGDSSMHSRYCRLLFGIRFASPKSLSSPLHTRAFYSTTKISLRAPQRSRNRDSRSSSSRHAFGADAQPARQAKKYRAPLLQRTSLVVQLQDVESSSGSNSSSVQSHHTASAVLSSSFGNAHSSTPVAPSHNTEAEKNAASPSITSPRLISAQRQAEINAIHTTSQQHTHRTTGVAAGDTTASLQLHEQLRALRDAFTHARRHHNILLNKDPSVYQAECKAFRQAHQGRPPTLQEVSRTVAVPLAPVSALKLLAHTDPKKSSLHSATAEAILLHNAVVKNELVKSNAPQLVRCLRCFHVYTGRPRTLWGDEVGQSGIEYAKVQAQQAADRQLQRKPWLRKRIASVGRRRRAQEEDPTCCPKCGSPRAQWMMEYVHHRTHEKP